MKETLVGLVNYVGGILRIMADKEYNYLCKRPDIKRFCDPSACTRHICGITPEKALEIANAKEAMGHIVEYKSNPPMYFEHTEVQDGNKMKLIRVEMSGSEIINKENLKIIQQRIWFMVY